MWPRSPVRPSDTSIAAMLAGTERALALQCVLAGGDDYELLFTAAPAAATRIEEISKKLALPLTRIGAITERRGLVVTDERGSPLATLPRAYDHFAVTDR